MKLTSPLFQITERVYIDREDLFGTITGILYRSSGEAVYILYEVEWIHNGINYLYWFPEYRLKVKE